MGPKKDKGASLKEVDPSIYVRNAIDFSSSADPRILPPNLGGTINNVETLFPEWDSETIKIEPWSEALEPEAGMEIIYPKHLYVKSHKRCKEYFNLSDPPPDPKKKKAAPKKGAVPEPEQMEERLQNELGQPLPVIFKESGNGVDEDVPEYMSYKTPRQFQK